MSALKLSSLEDSSYAMRGSGRGATRTLCVSALILSAIACTGSDDPQPGSSAQAGAQAAGTSKDWAKDDRLESLVVTCYGKGFFQGDTSDMLPVLIAKLQNSSLDVLRNVREELAREGQPAIVALDRLVRRLYSDVHSSPTIINALGVIQLSDAGAGELAQKLMKSCLGHPQETIRMATIRALTKHAQPAIFDDLLAVLDVTNGPAKGDVVTALYSADRKRLEIELVRWLEEGELRGLQQNAARLIAQGADADTAARFAPMIAVAQDPVVRAFLVSTRDDASEGASADFAILEEMLDDDDSQVRAHGLAALEYTGATDLVAAVLTSDPVPSLRMMACSLLGVRVEEPVAHAALIAGLNDSDDRVREACLQVLLAVGDERAADSALELLGGSQLEVAMATRALLGHYDENPGLAERALVLLVERFESRSRPAVAQNRYIVQALAQIPGPESTRWLLEQAAAFMGGSSGAADQRWFIMQASNTGLEGIEVLRQAWRESDDPVQRFHLLWAGSFGHDEATREFLLEVLEAERSAPYEVLYVAERLAREGPASLVAGRIKRANLRMSDRVFRPALECLLWRWYG